MVVADDACAGECEEAADGFADDGGAQVADVHLLGGVGRAVVDDPGLPGLRGAGGGAGGERFTAGKRGEPGLERGRARGEIDEAGAGDGDRVRGGDLGGQRGDEFLGEGARILFLTLGVAEHAIGLEIAVPGIGWAHVGGKKSGIETGRGGGGPQSLVERGGEVKRDVHPRTQPTPAPRAQARSKPVVAPGQVGPRSVSNSPKSLRWVILTRQVGMGCLTVICPVSEAQSIYIQLFT
ncbi:MAG: hypothetical protein BWX86_02205 [Verrucomicrobia bacterium ADurb.Bin122]|nr:MAG: hypothetical protein BWX86_02205 [Verrucomicrobia bacterium ADurb.Bin122]